MSARLVGMAIGILLLATLALGLRPRATPANVPVPPAASEAPLEVQPLPDNVAVV